MAEKERYLVFQIDNKFFAIDIDRVKKVIKEKGDSLKITPLDRAPRQVIGIAEVEITQNEKKLITFVDLRNISDVENFLRERDVHSDETKSLEEKIKDSQEEFHLKRRIFVVISYPEKEEYVGVLVSKVEGIFDFVDGKNAFFYEAPNIKGVKDLFSNVIIPYDTERKVFVVRAERIFEISGVI